MLDNEVQKYAYMISGSKRNQFETESDYNKLQHIVNHDTLRQRKQIFAQNTINYKNKSYK